MFLDGGQWIDEARRLRGEGLSFGDIAKTVGVSRQRVGFVLKGMPRPTEPVRVPAKCKFCGRDFLVRRSQLRAGRGEFCSMRCKARFYSPVAALAKDKARAREERLTLVAPMLHDGLPYAQIAARFGLSTRQIGRDARRLGYRRPASQRSSSWKPRPKPGD